MSTKKAALGKVQHRIMQVLWRRGSATAREVTDDLSREKPIAHSTVQTLLRKMETKGAVDHEIVDRTFVFRPLYAENEVKESALDDLLNRIFGGSVSGMVAHLLKQEKVSPEEMRRIRALIDEEEKR